MAMAATGQLLSLVTSLGYQQPRQWRARTLYAWPNQIDGHALPVHGLPTKLRDVEASLLLCLYLTCALLADDIDWL